MRLYLKVNRVLDLVVIRFFSILLYVYTSKKISRMIIYPSRISKTKANGNNHIAAVRKTKFFVVTYLRAQNIEEEPDALLRRVMISANTNSTYKKLEWVGRGENL